MRHTVYLPKFSIHSQNQVSHITVIPEDARLRYVFSEPTVRILKRPTKSAGDGEGLVNGEANKRVVKTLQQVSCKGY